MPALRSLGIGAGMGSAGNETTVRNQGTMFRIDALIFGKIAEPVAHQLCGTPFTPDVVSVIHGIILTMIMMWNMYKFGPTWMFIAGIYLRCLLDKLDGCIARACHNGSSHGDLVDTILDAIPAVVCLHFAW